MHSTTLPKETDAPIVNPQLPLQRIASIDVYRGFVMFLMMAEVLSFHRVAEALPESWVWNFLSYHQTHVPWAGCSLHDMIQPSFTFLVGVVLPYSVSGRINKGASFGNLLLHTIKRSLILILLGIFLRSLYSKQTNYTFEDTLTQIGLGYSFLFLISYCKRWIQVAILCALLIGYWLASAVYPLPGPDFNYGAAGVTAHWEHNREGFAAHWNKNTNMAWAFDRWFLNLFPREEPFYFNSGGYTTLSFIPTLGTMILGLFAGYILKSKSLPSAKVKTFVITGISLILLALLLHLAGVNPIVKRIWTPSWTLFSGGVCYLFIALFYTLIDVANKQKWSYFFMIIGVNSIAAYVLADGFGGFLSKSLSIHLGANFDQQLGGPYATLVRGLIILLIEWLILQWMFKKRIFIKI